MICDPMLATGGSAVAAGQLLKQRGAERLHFLHALAAPEGVRALRKVFPNEPVYLGAVDERLNENGYIHPGLGDAGTVVLVLEKTLSPSGAITKKGVG